MISLLHLSSYLAAVVAFLFVTLSLASGLLYIAELVEEHSRLAKLVGQRTIYTVIILHILFCFFDKLPLHLTGLGIVCHLVYLQNFSKTWPFISLSSPKFIASCVLVILDHFAWFFYFAERAKEHANSASAGRYGRNGAYRPNSWEHKYGSANKYAGMRELSFMDVATFFGVCVWLVPFFLFLSLSANDNVLPSLGGEQTPAIKTTSASDAGSPIATPSLNLRIQTTPRSSILKVALDPLLSLIPRIGSARFRSSRSQRDGLIASPIPSAPPSPSLYQGASAGPPSPLYMGSSYPASPGPNGYSTSSGYDNANLSPQTPFNARFAEQPSLRGAASSPNLRMPPGPKRSATSPPGNFGSFESPSAAESSASKGPAMYAGQTLHQASNAGSYLSDSPSKNASLTPSQEEMGGVIQRSTSPFGAQGAGTLSRRRGA